MEHHHVISRELAREAYETEVIRFVMAVKHLINNKTINNIFDYNKYVTRQSKNRNGIKTLIDASKGSFVIDLTTSSDSVWSLIDIAHIAACTSILKGLNFTESQFQPETLKKNLINAFPDTGSSRQEIIDSIAERLSRLDACRTAQILRVFGLFSRKPQVINQLALGCGSGRNDYDSLHQLCPIKKIPGETSELLSFDYIEQHSKNITLVDADSIHTARYEQLNELDASIHAVIGDMSDVLDDLKNTDVKKFNVVSVLRMEHRMIPDLNNFFEKLHPLISKDCDFIFSIGLGENVSDFEARTKLAAHVYDFLRDAKMRPVLFKLHEPGDYDRQISSIKFGHPVLATYQILHCKLNPSLIKKHFSHP